jgi:EAL domain-containing protein (putative c-di-GMP-specific phosphodiesterase class I)
MRRFNIHAIKLDGSLTREVLTNPNCREIIETIAHLCHSKDIRIIAEFVETEEQRDMLAQLGCEEFQGYLFSKPLPPEDFLGFLQSWNGVSSQDATPAAR